MNVISVILPVYNGEDRVSNCIESIITQTYKQFELIIINDGSSDLTLDIVNKFAEKDNRIKIISIENSGVSYARNKGLEKATGDYITFIDADDFYNNNFLERMHDLINKDNSDIAICNFCYFNKNKITKNKLSSINEFDKFSLILSEYCFQGYVWNKIYKRKIVQDVYFNTKITYLEDLLFNVKIFKKTNRIVYTNSVLYNYVINEESVVNNFSERNLTYFQALNKIRELVPNKSQIYINTRYLIGLIDFGSQVQFVNKAMYLNLKKEHELNKKYISYLNSKSKIKNIILKISLYSFSLSVYLYKNAMRINKLKYNISKKRLEKNDSK